MSPSCRRIPLGHKPPDVITPPGTKYPRTVGTYNRILHYRRAFSTMGSVFLLCKSITKERNVPFPRPCGATGNDAQKLHAPTFTHFRGTALMHEALCDNSSEGGFMALLRFLYSRRSLKRSTENSIPAFPLSRSDTPVSQAQRRPTLSQQLPRPGASRLIIALPPCVHGRSSHPPCSKRNGRRCGGHRHFPPTLLLGRAAERPSKPKPIEEPVRRSDARALDNRTPLKYAKICVRKPM